ALKHEMEQQSKSYWHWLGILLALMALGWVLYGIHPERLARDIGTIEWRWVLLALFLDLSSYIAQSLRWQLLLSPLANLSMLRVLQAIYVGIFANEVLPLRTGEIVRAYLISRWSNATISSVFSSIALERLFDGVIVVATVSIISIFFPFPQGLKDAS